MKSYLESCRSFLNSAEELLKHKAHILETRTEKLGIQRQLFESIRQEFESGKAFYATEVLEKMEVLQAVFTSLDGALQRIEAKHTVEDAPTPKAYGHANDNLSGKLMASRL